MYIEIRAIKDAKKRRASCSTKNIDSVPRLGTAGAFDLIIFTCEKSFCGDE